MMGKAVSNGTTTTAKYFLSLLVVLAVTGCRLDGENSVAKPPSGSGSGGSSGGTGGTPTTPAPTTNLAPKITGIPMTTAKVSIPYTFQPKASDPNGDKLTFDIKSKPDWASFDPSTGRLAGTPPPGSNGSYNGVQILVSDGVNVSELAPFSISVLEAKIGSAELSWQPPMTNDDGTPLSDLSGYVIRYGRNVGALDQSIRIENAGATMYVIENLVEGTWYFSLSAVNRAGVESMPTGSVSKSIG
jgi:Putative Ig domain